MEWLCSKRHRTTNPHNARSRSAQCTAHGTDGRTLHHQLHRLSPAFDYLVRSKRGRIAAGIAACARACACTYEGG